MFPRKSWVRPLLLINLTLNVLIVVTGGLVRLTGSGLGCPTWPQCVPGSYTPVPHQEQGYHKLIEFGNRTLTGVLGIAAILMVWALWKHARHRRALLIAAGCVLFGIVAQAIVGGITVRMVLNPWIVAFHLLASMMLVAATAYLVVRERIPDEPLVDAAHPLVRKLGYGVVALTAVVLVLGTIVTGSGPHSGDATAPARTGLDAHAMSWLHADTVMLFCGLVIGIWVAARLSDRTVNGRVARAWLWVVVVTIAQGVVGYVQYFTKLPAAVVLTHMLGASLLVVAVTAAMVRSRAPQSQVTSADSV